MNQKQYRILIVEDDKAIRTLIETALEDARIAAISAYNGASAVSQVRTQNPDVILLDLGLPDMDGIQVVDAIRRITINPIIIVSARSDDADKIEALDHGADDYVTKPFEGKELVARVKAVLRRAAPGESEKDTLSFPGLTISLEKYEVHFQGKIVEMPPKELEVLYFLASHQNRVFTREQLLEQVWGFDFFGDSRTVDVHIKRLREKLQDSEQLGWQIRTVWGVGYKFEVK